MCADRRILAPLIAALAGCAVQKDVAVEPVAVVVEPVSAAAAAEVSVRAMLAFYRKSRGMSRAELARERAALKGNTEAPMDALRLAMLLGHERSELPRALGLLDGIARSDAAQAQPLQPLARLLADQYGERLKLESQLERTGHAAREAERRAGALQDKLDALAEIERSLPGRPAPALPSIEGER